MARRELDTLRTLRTTAKFQFGLVIPLDTEDVIATVAVCREFGAPILARGGGTSLAGQCPLEGK
jgi:FAD/FMN-containing dehydrogenase